jgi:hypothetical protein
MMLDDDSTTTTTLAEAQLTTLATRDTSHLSPLLQGALARARRGCATAAAMIDELTTNPPTCPVCGGRADDAEVRDARAWLKCTTGHWWAPTVPERSGR